MSRLPTLEEALAVLRLAPRRLTRVDRALSLAFDGWSRDTVLAYASFHPETHHRAAVLTSAYAEELDLHAHGIQPPTSDRKSKRKRHDPRPAFDPLQRYRE
jgi:hypothetical protein